MREETQKWHLDVLATHKASLYNTLLHEHNVCVDNMKEIVLDEPCLSGANIHTGYYAKKDRKKYFIDEKTYNQLPVRITRKEKMVYRDDVVFRVWNIKPFRITPEHTIPFKEMIDGFMDFKHSEPDTWTLMKIVAMVSYYSKLFICVSSMPSFGKSAVFKALHALTEKCPVFNPRSVPGVLNQITNTGNMVFDDVKGAKKEVKVIMEQFSLLLGDNSVEYINGAMKSNQTKDRYDTVYQSITYLYNEVQCYANPEKDYFDVMFQNNPAIDDRFLKFKFKGTLLEEFDKSFDIKKVAEENKMEYIGVVKELEYLREHRTKNEYALRWKPLADPYDLKTREIQLYKEILWGVDLYSESQEMFSRLQKVLNDGLLDYKEMVAPLTGQEKRITEVEVVE